MDNENGRSRVLFFVKGIPHSFYKEQFLFSPDNFKYIPSTKLLESDMRTAIEFVQNPLTTTIKNIGRFGLQVLGVPSLGTINSECDLVHSAETLLISDKPWVVDFEDTSSFCWFDPRMLTGRTKWLIERLLKDKNCKKILPWTVAAQNNINVHLDSKQFKDKIEVVYPAIRPKSLNQRKTNVVNFLFIGKYFYSKGGMETVLAFEKLSKRYDAYLHMVTPAPSGVLNRFSRNQNIKFYSKINGAELNKLYSNADVFVLPYHLDSLGYVIMEAMSYGIPCIIPDNYSGNELIEDGISGLLVKDRIENYKFTSDFRTITPPIYHDEDTSFFKQLQNPSDQYINQIYTAMVKFIEDNTFRHLAAKNSYKSISTGKFSIRVRKEALNRIYEECLKK